MTLQEFQADLRGGIPHVLPEPQAYDNMPQKERTSFRQKKRNWH